MKEGPIKTLGYLDPYWRPIYGYGEVEKSVIAYTSLAR